MKKLLSRLGPALCALVLCAAALAIPTQAEDAYFTRGSLCVKVVEVLGLEYREEMASSYADVPTTRSDYQAISIMLYYGVIIEDSDFYPDNTITRAEVAAVLCRVMGSPVSEGALPADVEDSDWFADYVRYVVAAGLMAVDDNGNFDPHSDARITDVDWDRLSALLGLTSGTISLDLANGSIVITQNYIGLTVYTQGETTITGSASCIVRQSNNGTATENTITVRSGTVTIVLAGVKIKTTQNDATPISVWNGAKLTLDLIGENTVAAKGFIPAGIRVPKGATLVIQGSGSLTASGGGEGAGIGGSWGSSAVGDITINSGTVSAYSGFDNAGIGGNGGTVTINGGIVTASGYYWGIGGENCAVTINGGTVNTTSNCGVGIGGDASTVIITGGTVNATGNYHGIGGGASTANTAATASPSVRMRF
jgi:hypothetical protein